MSSSLFVFLSTVALIHAVEVDFSSPVQRIAFGSCNQHIRHQRTPRFPKIVIISTRVFPTAAWKAIAATSPDIFVWLGDVVYTDVRRFPLIPFISAPGPLARVEEFFTLQKTLPDYAAFIQTTPVFGTWVLDFSSLHAPLFCECWPVFALILAKRQTDDVSYSISPRLQLSPIHAGMK